MRKRIRSLFPRSKSRPAPPPERSGLRIVWTGLASDSNEARFYLDGKDVTEMLDVRSVKFHDLMPYEWPKATIEVYLNSVDILVDRGDLDVVAHAMTADEARAWLEARFNVKIEEES